MFYNNNQGYYRPDFTPLQGGIIKRFRERPVASFYAD